MVPVFSGTTVPVLIIFVHAMPLRIRVQSRIAVLRTRKTCIRLILLMILSVFGYFIAFFASSDGASTMHLYRYEDVLEFNINQPLILQDLNAFNAASAAQVFNTSDAAGTDPKTKKRKAVVVDILSIASNSRKSYYQTQQRTWANHSLVRNFMYVTEDLDDPTSACRNMSVDVAVQILAWCKEQYSGTTEGSWMMRRYLQNLAQPKWLMRKADPVAWLCAQRRFPLGVAKIILGYGKEERNESLPDYLLVVDDDTYYNMDLFHDLIIGDRDPNAPFVGAGCRVTNGHNANADPRGLVFPFGGFGLTYSKGSLERFLKPIHVDALDKLGGDGDALWEISTIATIQNDNLIYERESFHDGMSVAELMEAYVKKDPFQDFYNWTRGFCFHGDWLLAAIQQLYGLHSSLLMDALSGSEIVSGQGGGNCLNGAGDCNISHLLCHYQRPSDMERLSSSA